MSHLYYVPRYKFNNVVILQELLLRTRAKYPQRDPRQTERWFGCSWTRRNRQILRTPYPPLRAPTKTRSNSHLRPPLVFLPPPFLTQSCRVIHVVILLYRYIIIMYLSLQTTPDPTPVLWCHRHTDFSVVDLFRTGRTRSNPLIAP